MSFTQENHKKIAKCDGCRKHCVIDTKQSADKKHLPTINGTTISCYFDKTGKIIHIKPNKNKYLIIKQGLAICELCDRHR